MRLATTMLAAFMLVSLSGCAVPPTREGGAENGPGLTNAELAGPVATASPQLLAQGYLAVDGMLPYLQFARKGVPVHTQFNGRPVVITAANVEHYEQTLSERRALYAAEIEKRGYRNLAGTYVVRVSKPCAEAKATASLLADEKSGMSNRIVITQDRFRLTVSQRGAGSDQAAELRHDGIVVGTELVIRDALSPDFTYVGSVVGQGIELRPWVELIQEEYSHYRPNFPSRPDWNALSQCVLTLTRR